MLIWSNEGLGLLRLISDKTCWESSHCEATSKKIRDKLWRQVPHDPHPDPAIPDVPLTPWVSVALVKAFLCILSPFQLLFYAIERALMSLMGITLCTRFKWRYPWEAKSRNKANPFPPLDLHLHPDHCQLSSLLFSIPITNATSLPPSAPHLNAQYPESFPFVTPFWGAIPLSVLFPQSHFWCQEPRLWERPLT